MTAPSGSPDRDDDRADAGSVESGTAPGRSDEAPFDPYRFGKPDTPPPPEYAPPGYVPDAPAAAPPASPYPPPNYTPPGYQGQGYPPPGYPPPGYAPPGQSGQSGQGWYGAPPAGAGQYGPPPGYRTPPYPPPSRDGSGGNGKATAALVLGIVSIVLCWTTFVDIVFVVLAVVFGSLGMSDARRRNGAAHGRALAGLVCGVIGAALAIVITVFAIHVTNNCSGVDRDSTAYSQCIRDQL